eukprot:gene4411-4664_t
MGRCHLLLSTVMLLLASGMLPCSFSQKSDVTGEVIVAYNSADSVNQSDGPGAVAAAAATTAVLADLPDVRMVVPNTFLSTPKQPEMSQYYKSASASCTGTSTSTDSELGKSSEGAPYGVKMVQADDAEVVEVSRLYKHQVMWCVVDTGLDPRNQEFPADATGCSPDSLPAYRSGNATSSPARSCMPWDDDGFGHGTHVAGIISAVRNDRAIVGVSAQGAQIYAYKFLDNTGSGSADGEVAAWADCLAEFDARKASNPQLKMVVSMSYGSYQSNAFSQDFLTQAAASRSDVLWFAAAGNDKLPSSLYPAGYKEVISVSAVDWNLSLAPFSNYGSDVFLAAPGVSVLSTFPLALTQRSRYHTQGFTAVVTNPLIPDEVGAPDFFRKPAPVIFTGSGLQDVTAPLVDCGLAQETCANATGRICLIQRGVTMFCKKAQNCMAGGGVGVLVYNNDADGCAILTGPTLLADGCPSNTTWPVALMLSRTQGEALTAAVARSAALGTILNATIRVPQKQQEIGLDWMSGTSQATPAAAAVGGLVWSAFPNCTAAEVRRALAMSALKGQGQTQMRSTQYGYGIVQAKSALQYMRSNPCAADKSTSQLVLTITPANQRQGRNVTVRAQVQDAVTGRRLAGMSVKLVVRPSSKLMACSESILTTNKNGVARTLCRVLKAGASRLVATVVANQRYNPSSSAQEVQTTA